MLAKVQKYLQIKFINFIVKDLFNAIDENDILQIQGKTLIYKKEILPANRTVSFAEDAEALKDSKLWKMICNEVKFKANMKMYNKAQNIQDMLAGKAALYVLEVINNKLNKLSSLQN